MESPAVEKKDREASQKVLDLMSDPENAVLLGLESDRKAHDYGLLTKLEADSSRFSDNSKSGG